VHAIVFVVIWPASAVHITLFLPNLSFECLSGFGLRKTHFFRRRKVTKMRLPTKNTGPTGREACL